MWTWSRVRRVRRLTRYLPLPRLHEYLRVKEADLNWERKQHLWLCRSIRNVNVLGDS